MGLFSCLRKVQPEEAPATKAKPSKYADLAAWSDSTSNTLAHDPREPVGRARGREAGEARGAIS